MAYSVVKLYYESRTPPKVGTQLLRYEGVVGGLSRIWHLAELDNEMNVVKVNGGGGYEKIKNDLLERWKKIQKIKKYRIANGLPLDFIDFNEKI